MAQLLINVVHQTGAVEGAGAAPAGDIPAAQQALGHSRRGGPQLAGALKISAHQGDVLGGYIAGLHLIPAVAQIGHDVHHHARLQRPHLFAVGAGLGPDVEHIGGNQPPLLLGLLGQGGGRRLDNRAVGQGDLQPLAGHVPLRVTVCNLIPAVPCVLLYGDLGALGSHGQGFGAGAGLTAQTQVVGGDGGGADRGKRHAGACGKNKPGGGQGPDQLHFEIHWNLPPQYFLWYRPVTCPPARA